MNDSVLGVPDLPYPEPAPAPMEQRLGGIPAELVTNDIHLNPPGSEAWINSRIGTIGSSEAATAIGHGGYDSPWTLWHRKTGTMEPPEENEAMIAGNLLEPIVANYYAETHPDDIVIAPHLTFRHPEQSWATASPDLFVNNNGLVEIKTTSVYSADRWADGAVPAEYLWQARWLLWVTGREWCDLAVLIGGSKFKKPVRVRRNLDTEAAMIEGARRFLDMVENGTPPQSDHRDDVASMYPNSEDDTVTILTPEEAEHHEQAVRLAAQIKPLEEQAKTAKNRLRDAMGTAEIGIAPDGETKLVTWEPNAKGTRVLRLKNTKPKTGLKAA